jgi:hypothetical protein
MKSYKSIQSVSSVFQLYLCSHGKKSRDKLQMTITPLTTHYFANDLISAISNTGLE